VQRYSLFSLLGHALRGDDRWPRAWRAPEPKKSYDAVIIGGGGHGLATAYYLAKQHGIRDVAVLEKGWLGGGNTGRNTTIVRSNYHLDANAHFYEFSLKLWERLSQELNFNVMYSARGVLNLVHTPADIDAAMRRGNAMRLNGIDAKFLSRDEIAAWIPRLDCSPNARFPVLGGLLQPRGGTVRHDAVAWGYARAADALEYAHRRNVVHRDIKPANIMYDSLSNNLKITDFGIAKLIDANRTRTGIVLGTPAFMSPEQLEGKNVNGHTDLFALGVSLYQLLTGQLPFRGASMTNLMFVIANEPHQSVTSLRSELPKWLDEVVDRALAKSPADRFESAAAMAAALRRAA